MNKQHFSVVAVSLWSRNPGEPGREGAPASSHDPSTVHPAGPAPDSPFRTEEHGCHALREAAAADGTGSAAAGAGRPCFVSGMFFFTGEGSVEAQKGVPWGHTQPVQAEAWGRWGRGLRGPAQSPPLVYEGRVRSCQKENHFKGWLFCFLPCPTFFRVCISGGQGVAGAGRLWVLGPPWPMPTPPLPALPSARLLSSSSS